MTQLMRQALEAVSRLPEDRQEELARFLLEVSAADGDAPALSEAERAAIAEAEGELARGERIPERTINDFWRSRGT